MLGVLLAASLATATPAAADPYQIFAQSRRYWESQRYPMMLEYDVAVSVVEHGTAKTERYQMGYDGSDGSLAFDPVSDYEQAHPYYPHGFNFALPFVGPIHAPPLVDFLGVPMLAPNYGFGIGATPRSIPPDQLSSAELVREVRAAFHDPDPRASATPSPSPSPGLREIAVVSTRVRTYDITLVGIESIDGEPVYHLKLRPLRDPSDNRLRELWIDTSSYAPRKLVEALNFVSGPGTTVPWSVTFAQSGNVSYIDRETALAPVTFEKHHYSDASLSFENVHEVDKFSGDLSRFVPDQTQLMIEP
jgi:hypothetical protein